MRFFFILFTIYRASHAEDIEFRLGCLREEYNAIIKSYKPNGLTFVPGEKVPFWHPRKNRSTVVPEVTLTVSESDDLKGVARVLAAGTGGNYRKTLNKLKKAAASDGSIDLREVSPDIVLNLTNKTNKSCKDADCLNAVLNWHDPTVTIKYTKADDFRKALRDHYDELEKGSELKFGDVAVFEDNGKLVHSSIYLDENLMWHKPGHDMRAPYIFETVEGVFDDYYEEGLSSLRFFRRRPPAKY